MVARCMVSRRRAGNAIGLTETPPYIHAEVSRTNIWFGSGGSTKVAGLKLAPTSPSGVNGRSSPITPPIRERTSSGAGSESNHWRSSGEALAEGVDGDH